MTADVTGPKSVVIPHNTSISDLRFWPMDTILTVRWPQQQEDSENTGTLWASTDKGGVWRPLSKLQGIVPDQALAPFGATSANATIDRPLYLSVASHVPSRMLYLKAAQIVDDRHWAYLPPLPVKGASADHIGITSILGVTASGKLLAFGVSPTADVTALRSPDEDFQQQWLWSWDPHAQRWTSLAPPLPVAVEGMQRRLLAGVTRSERGEPADRPVGARIRLREQR